MTIVSVLRLLLFMFATRVVVLVGQMELQGTSHALVVERGSLSWFLRENASSRVVLAACGVTVILSGETHAISCRRGESWQQDDGSFTLRAESARATIELELVLSDTGPTAFGRVGVTNTSKRDFLIDEVRLDPPTRTPRWWISPRAGGTHLNGYQSWSSCEAIRPGEEGSGYWNMLTALDEAALLLGWGPCASGVGRVGVGESGFWISQEFRGARLAPGQTAWTDTWAAFVGHSADEVLGKYSAWLAAHLGGGRWEAPLGGWCSWYSFAEAVTEQDVMRNLDSVQELAETGLEVIQLDDGYQVACGEWETGPEFPGGHARLVQAIHGRGLKAGLWLAPFVVGERSRLAREHPEWLQRGPGGPRTVGTRDRWGGRLYALDPSAEEVRRWLGSLLRTATREWGYNYVKLDFLYLGLATAQGAGSLAPGQAYRQALAAMREGAEEGTHVLGCGAPLGLSMGLVDGMRIGPDIAPLWFSVMEAARSLADRSFLGGAVWLNDPDCVVVRDPLTPSQARVWATLVSLSGGPVLVGDDLASLPQGGRELLRKCLPPAPWQLHPVGLLEPEREQGLRIVHGRSGQSAPLPQEWLFRPGDDLQWCSPSLRDDHWEKHDLPRLWENGGHGHLNGWGWYRVRFRLPSDWERGHLLLQLGKVDDADQCFINGHLVGQTGSLSGEGFSAWQQFRVYSIPERCVRWDGDNILALRVLDYGGGGGLWSGSHVYPPSQWWLHAPNGWRLVVLVNWKQAPAQIEIDLQRPGWRGGGPWHAYECSDGGYVPTVRDGTRVPVPPTSCVVLSLRRKGPQPDVLASDRHVSGGGLDIAELQWEEPVLRGRSTHLLAEPYRMVLYVPEPFRASSIWAEVPASLDGEGPGVVTAVLSPAGEQQASWGIRFSRHSR